MDLVNEKQVREKIMLDRRGKFSIKENNNYSKSLDFNLETMSQCNRLGLHCPISEKAVRLVAQEPDHLYDLCLSEASNKFKDHVKDYNEQKGGRFFKEYVNSLIVETAIGLGIKALLEAYQNET